MAGTGKDGLRSGVSLAASFLKACGLPARNKVLVQSLRRACFGTRKVKCSAAYPSCCHHQKEDYYGPLHGLHYGQDCNEWEALICEAALEKLHCGAWPAAGLAWLRVSVPRLPGVSARALVHAAPLVRQTRVPPAIVLTGPAVTVLIRLRRAGVVHDSAGPIFKSLCTL